MAENKRHLNAIRGFISYLKHEEEFSGKIVDTLKELVGVIMDLFIRFEEEK